MLEIADGVDRLSLILFALCIGPDRIAWRADWQDPSECRWEAVR